MAGTYTAKIKFSSDTSSLNKMEKDLSNRFTKIAKRFGNGLKAAGKVLALGGGGVTAILGLLTSLLDPITALNEKIDGTLERADDLTDRAETLGTSVSRYAALSGALQVQGLDQGNIDMMINQITTLLGEAKSGKKNILSEYSGETDIAKVMYQVLQQIRNITDRGEQARVIADIFGQRMVAKLGGVMANGIDEGIRAIGAGINWQSLDTSIKKLGDLQDYQAGLIMNRQLREIVSMANGLVDKTLIDKQQAIEELKSKNLQSQIKSYDDLAKIAISMEIVKNMTIKGTGYLAEFVGWATGGATNGLKDIITRMDKIADKLGMGKGKV